MTKQLVVTSREIDSPYRKIKALSGNILSVYAYYEKRLSDVNFLFVTPANIFGEYRNDFTIERIANESSDKDESRKYCVFIEAPNGEYSDLLSKIRRNLNLESNMRSILAKYSPICDYDNNTIIMRKYAKKEDTIIDGMKIVSANNKIVLFPIYENISTDIQKEESATRELEEFKSFIERYVFDSGIACIPDLLMIFGRSLDRI